MLLLEARITWARPVRCRCSPRMWTPMRWRPRDRALSADDQHRDQPKRLQRFFTRLGGGYQVTQALRDVVIFFAPNLLRDPPFSRMDLISCRNVLIYLEAAAQRKVLSMFSFALNTGGCLMLGKSEGVSGVEDLFEPVSKRQRIFRMVRSRRRTVAELPLYTGGGQSRRTCRARPIGAVLAQANLEAMLGHFGATALLVDARADPVFLRTDREVPGPPQGSRQPERAGHDGRLAVGQAASRPGPRPARKRSGGDFGSGTAAKGLAIGESDRAGGPRPDRRRQAAGRHLRGRPRRASCARRRRDGRRRAPGEPA